MPRPKHKVSSDFPYHITARCINKEWFQLPMDEVWEIMSIYLYFIHHAFGVRIHLFVLMNNHFHLILSTPFANLSKAMEYFMRQTSIAISRRLGRINQVWGCRYHRCLIDRIHYYSNAYKYVYRNPVEAGLSLTVEEYKYSTLNGLLGQQHLLIPVENDTLLFGDEGEDLEGQLIWLNDRPLEKHSEQIGRALKKSVFKLSSSNKRKSRLEIELL